MRTEVYSWRLSGELKSDLEREARLRKVPVSAVLETAVRDWLKKGDTDISEDEAQRRLHTAAANSLGVLASGLDSAMAANALVANALIDTGAILALIDRSDRWHNACADAFRQLRLPLLTSEAVLTEVFHLVGDSRTEMEAAWKFVRSGALVLGTIEHAELTHLHGLMSRYWDRPMDFADATLVYLAKRESLSVILTVDPVDFATYRIEGKRQFRVVPSRRP